MSITVKVSCPVCHGSLAYEHKEPEAWGSVSLTDFAVVELTAHDKGAVREHMMTHYSDGTWEAALRARAGRESAMVQKLDERATKAWQQEALAFAEHGSKVAVFADTLTIAQGFLEDFEAILAAKAVKRVSRLNGAHAIEFHSGGEIRFYSTRSIPRGKSLDRVYVPASVRDEAMEKLAPLVMTSQQPAIVGYL